MPERSRQLAAIMFTDIVGYTKLMGEDEEKAFELLKKNRKVQRPLIEAFSGRWLKEIGDGVLASFDTVSDAVYCAGAIQKACENEPDLKLRIGIHLGEVVFEGEDVFGDGVNIASRLEPLAPPGGIMVSESVHNNVLNKKGITSEFVREENLKNVKQPVRIFQVKVLEIPEPEISPGMVTTDRAEASGSKPSYRTAVLGGAGLILFLLAAYLIYNNISGSEPAQQSSSQIEILDKSIAVLPFKNMSGDPEQEFLCDGLTEEIIHHLSLIKSFDKVTSRSSVMTFKDSDKTLTEIAQQLNVDIVLQGSFRKSGDQIKINAQLIEAAHENHLWSKVYERPFGDILEVQSDIAKQIATRFNAGITEEEASRLDRKPTKSSEAYILLSKGWYELRNHDFKGAINLFNQAVEADPNFAEAYAALAIAYLSATGHRGDTSIPVEDPLPLVKEALRLDPELGVAYSTLGQIHHGKEWDFLEAELAYKKALELEPKNPLSIWLYANFLVQIGRAAEALPYMETAVELDPTNPLMLNQLGKFFSFAGKNKKAIESMREYEALFPNAYPSETGQNYLYLDSLDKAITYLEKGASVPLHNSFLAIAYAKNGAQQKALELVEELKQLAQKKVVGSPEYSVGLYYSGTDQKEEALYWLERAYASHDTELYWLKAEPMFKSLHGDPRYEDLLRKIGFPE